MVEFNAYALNPSLSTVPFPCREFQWHHRTVDPVTGRLRPDRARRRTALLSWCCHGAVSTVLSALRPALLTLRHHRGLVAGPHSTTGGWLQDLTVPPAS